MKTMTFDLDVKLSKLRQACKDTGLSLTIQRRRVFETLLSRKDHPSADDLYHDIRVQLPGISRTTVYRVLDTLVELECHDRDRRPRDGPCGKARSQRRACAEWSMKGLYLYRPDAILTILHLNRMSLFS